MSKRARAAGTEDQKEATPSADAEGGAGGSERAVAERAKQQKRERQWLRPRNAGGGRLKPRIGADFQVAALPEPAEGYPAQGAPRAEAKD